MTSHPVKKPTPLQSNGRRSPITYLTQEETKRLFAAIPTKRDRALSSPPTATATGRGPRLILAVLSPASRSNEEAR